MCGIPKLGNKAPGICGLCQLDKQIKVMHRKVHAITTLTILELLHMNLMGPTLVESIGGKR